MITLASVPTFLTRWLIPRLPEFRRRHPQVTLSFSRHLAPAEDMPARGRSHPVWIGQLARRGD